MRTGYDSDAVKSYTGAVWYTPNWGPQCALPVCFTYVTMYCCVLVPSHVPTRTLGMTVALTADQPTRTRTERSRPTSRPEPELEPNAMG